MCHQIMLLDKATEVHFRSDISSHFGVVLSSHWCYGLESGVVLVLLLSVTSYSNSEHFIFV